MQVQSSHLSVLALPLSTLGSPRWLGFKQLPNRLPYKNRQKHYSSMEPNGTKRIQARSQAKSLQIGCKNYNFNNLYQASRSCRRLIPCMAVSATKGHDKRNTMFESKCRLFVRVVSANSCVHDKLNKHRNSNALSKHMYLHNWDTII